MFLSELSPARGSKKRPKRVGRGPGSGHGKTACRGHKGQKSRSGYSKNPGFEGGQMPLHRRLPKRGFTNIFRVPYQVVNLRRLASFEEGAVVDPPALKQAGLIRKEADRIKILGEGSLEVKLIVVADAFSGAARKAIEEKGGSAQLRAKAEEQQP